MNRAGSVDIANTILQKITTSTMVIGDVTPVLTDSERKLYYPNPNVMLELGFAAKSLGWTRVTCLVNESVCEKESLPFDIRHRRLTGYTCKDEASKKVAGECLQGILYNVVRTVIEEIGRGEFDASLTNTELKHSRDERLLRQLLSRIHRSYLDRYIEHGLRYQLFDDCNYFWIGFDGMICSSHFRFYDKELERKATELWKVWGTSVQLSGLAFYPGRGAAQFVLKDELYWDDKYQETLDAMIEAFKELPQALKTFLDHVHDHYPEIDMVDTDKAAWKDNLPYIRGDMFNDTEDEDHGGPDADSEEGVIAPAAQVPEAAAPEAENPNPQA